MTTTLEYQDYSTKLIVSIKGENRQDIIEQHWSFYNHGATNQPELWWMCSTEAYFYTTREKLLKAMITAELFRLLNAADESDTEENCFKGCKGGAMPYARVQAQERFDGMIQNPRESFVNQHVDYYGYDSNHGRAENLSDSDA
jgi:hypothetical protein